MHADDSLTEHCQHSPGEVLARFGHGHVGRPSGVHDHPDRVAMISPMSEPLLEDHLVLEAEDLEKDSVGSEKLWTLTPIQNREFSAGNGHRWARGDIRDSICGRDGGRQKATGTEENGRSGG